MTDTPKPTLRQILRRFSPVAALRILSAATLLLFPLIGIVRMGGREGAGATQAGELLLFVACGLACGGLLLGLSILSKLLQGLQESFGRFEKNLHERGAQEIPGGAIQPGGSGAIRKAPSATGGSVVSSNGPTGATIIAADYKRLVTLLEDIRDNALLTEEERGAKKKRLADEEVEEAVRRIAALTQEGDFSQARQIAEHTARRHPDEARASELLSEVENAREGQESEDVRSYTRQVNDLISISAWGRARDLVQQLQDRHPNSIESRQLMLRVEREYRVFEEEQRRRMAAEVQRCVTKRRWEEALAAARMFIERFPGCEESEALRLQLPTLETNAEIEARQRLENLIMNYVKRGRYLEALDLANKVIEQYPDSPQADALRRQKERLEQLAHDPKAPPARIRLD